MRATTTLLLPIIIILPLLLIIGLPSIRETVAQTQKTALLDFIDTVSLGITTSEALKKFEAVEPKPLKLTANIYGAKVTITHGPTGKLEDTAFRGTLAFCSDQLAFVFGEFETKNEEFASWMFSTLKSDAEQYFNSVKAEEECLTTETCEWQIPSLHYAMVLSEKSEAGKHYINMTRRLTSIATPTCANNIINEMKETQKK